VLLTEFTAAETVQVFHLIPSSRGNRMVTANRCAVKVMKICTTEEAFNPENNSIFEQMNNDGY